MGNYRELLAWQAAHELVVEVYRISAGWSRDERYGLIAQARRAAFSVAANIVEGSRKRGGKEFRRFLDIAWGSVGEVEYTIDLAVAVGVATPAQLERLGPLAQRAGQLVYRLARSLSPPC